jgi:aconitate decarboxylase
VTLTTPVMQYVNRPHPDTGLAGKFSLQYTFASGLLRGAVKIDTFTDQEVVRPDMVALLDKITMNMTPEISSQFNKMSISADVEMTDGRKLHARCDGPPGIWGSPPISETDHLVKVRDCLGRRLPSDRSEAVIALAGRVETLDAAGVREILALVA